MKMKNVLMALVVTAVAAGYGEAYDPAIHGNPIVVTVGTVEIDGLVNGTNTVINGLGKVRCATLGAGVTLKNFTLRNGKSDWGGGALGGKLFNCRIENCTADLGGGAYGATLVNCEVVNCTAVESGAALGDCKATVCAITGNRHVVSSSKVPVQGGVFFGSELANCTIKDNDIQCASTAPLYGGIGARSTLTGCTVSNNKVVCDDDVVYGKKYYDSTVDEQYFEYNDDTDEDEGETPSGDDPGDDIYDGSLARYFTCALDDGSVLTFLVAKQTVRNGHYNVTFTAKLTTKAGANAKEITYSYSGGTMVDGEVTKLPTCRTYGAPKFSDIIFGIEVVSGILGDDMIAATEVDAELFEDGEFVLLPLVARVGVAVTGQVSVASSWGPVKYSASKLPNGLKLNSKTGVVTGVPTKAGRFMTKVTVTSTLSSKFKSVMEFPFDVDAIDDWAVGTFDGGGDGSQITLTVTKAGNLSGKQTVGGKTWTLSSASYVRYDENPERYAADVLFKSGSGKGADSHTSEVVVVDGDDGVKVVFGGVATNESFIAYQNRWKLSPWKELAKSFSKAAAYEYAPEGFGTNDVVALKMASSGKVTVKGKFVKSIDAVRGRISWLTVSGKAVLCPQTEPDANGAFRGVVFVYFPPKAKTVLANGYFECVPVVWNGSEFVAP